MHRLALGAAAFFAFAALTAFFLWLQGARSADRAGAFTHMHCPDCGMELRYDAAKEESPCPQCGPAGPKRMIATVGPRRDQRASVGWLGKTLVAMLGALIPTLGALYGWILYAAARRRTEEQTRKRPLVCACPFCSRKIGYPAQKVGMGAVCPRCKTAFVLPEGIVLEEVSCERKHL